MKWFLNRKVEYYPFDVTLVGRGYVNEMKRDVGWAFKNVFFYYIGDVEYSYRSETDMKSLKKFLKKRFNSEFAKKFGALLKKRSEIMLSITQECFRKKSGFAADLPKLYQSVYDFASILQFPELAQNLVPEADKKLLVSYGLVREAAVKKLLAAEKIWRSQLGEKLGLPPRQALMLLPDEVLEYLKTGRLPKNFKSRKNLIALFTNGREKFLWNREADEFFNKEVGSGNKKADKIQGSPAYSGIVTGKAFVSIRPNDFKKIPAGSILICSTTRYSFVPYLKRVKGIVADEGGITSHASIVSRELKIPTIVGAKGATDYFKTGDIIRLDANKGIVEKIN